MEKLITLSIQQAPDGIYVATSNDIKGLLVQGKTICETIDIAKRVAQKILSSQLDLARNLVNVRSSFEYPLVINT